MMTEEHLAGDRASINPSEVPGDVLFGPPGGVLPGDLVIPRVGYVGEGIKDGLFHLLLARRVRRGLWRAFGRPRRLSGPDHVEPDACVSRQVWIVHLVAHVLEEAPDNVLLRLCVKVVITVGP